MMNKITNYVLIDLGNIQPKKLSALYGHEFKVIVFVGENQARLNFELAKTVQRLGSDTEYVKISGSGSNALDFHFAFYIGEILATDADSYFHIISKDKGFDPLIK